MMFNHVERTIRANDATVTRCIARGVPFVAIDPGDTGAAVVFDFNSRGEFGIVRVVPFVAGVRSHLEVARECALRRVRVVVIEDQFLGKNVNSMKDLIRSAENIKSFIQLGWLQSETANEPDRPENAALENCCYCIWVNASVWGSQALHVAYNTKRAVRKAKALEIAKKHPYLMKVLQNVPVKYRDGIADAYCIGLYWEHGRFAPYANA